MNTRNCDKSIPSFIEAEESYLFHKCCKENRDCNNCLRLSDASIWHGGWAERRRYWLVDIDEARCALALGWDDKSGKYVIIKSHHSHFVVENHESNKRCISVRSVHEQDPRYAVADHSGGEMIVPSLGVRAVLRNSPVTEFSIDNSIVLMLGGELKSRCETLGSWQQDWIQARGRGVKGVSSLVGPFDSDSFNSVVVVALATFVRMWINDGDFF